jgi:hypothetical protein
MKALSAFFYQRTGIKQCLGMTVLMVLYASVVMGGQSACFQDQLAEGMRVLGLKRGYDLAYVQAMFGAMNESGLQCYRELVLVWDNLFPLFYGTMYVFWLSWLGRQTPMHERWTGLMNLFPLVPAAMDWVENYFELRLVDEFLVGSGLTETAVATASWVSQIKWLFSSLNYLILLFALIWFIRVKLSKSQKA